MRLLLTLAGLFMLGVFGLAHAQAPLGPGTGLCTQLGGYPFQSGQCLNGSDLSNALELSIGGSPPQNAQGVGAGQGKLWLDTSVSPSIVRMCVVASPSSCSTGFVPSEWMTWTTVDFGNTIINWPIGGGTATVASSGVVDLGLYPQAALTITGSASINSFGTSLPPGRAKLLVFTGAATIVYSAGAINVPGNANIVTQAGGAALVWSLGGGKYTLLYQPTGSGGATMSVGLPVANNNVALVGGSFNVPLTPTNGTLIYRAGFYNPGDGGGAYYTFSSANCTVNTGAGDNGSQVKPATGGGCWMLSALAAANVRVWGAAGDGVTNDTPTIQAAANTLTGGGTVIFPPGHYCIKTGPLTTSTPAITFEGQNSGGGNGAQPPGGISAVILDACGTDVSIFNLSGRHNKLSNIKVIGSQTVGTTKPAVTLSGGAGGCSECRIVDSYVTGGSNAVNAANAYEIWLLGNSFDTSYGSALVYLGTTGGYILNNKLDGPYFPAGTPPAGTAAPANWAATTAYATGALAIDGSYIIQATVGGTSGGSLPTVRPYGVNISDGSVTWRLVGNSTNYAIQCDTGCGADLYIENNDFSAAFTTAIVMTNSLSGTQPSGITIARNTFDSNQNGYIGLRTGQLVTISGNSFYGCVITGCTMIEATAPFGGDLTILDNRMIGGSGAGMTGIFIGNGVVRTTIVGNQIAPVTTAVSIAAGTQAFTITGNELGGEAVYGSNTNCVFVAAGSSDFYTIVGNDCTGSTLTDGGTGVHKSVIDGNSGYAKVAHILGVGPAPTISGGMGTGATIVGSDGAMRIATGTSPTGTPTVNFGTAWPNAPVCSAINESNAANPLQTFTGTTAVQIFPTASLPASGHISIMCSGY